MKNTFTIKAETRHDDEKVTHVYLSDEFRTISKKNGLKIFAFQQTLPDGSVEGVDFVVDGDCGRNKSHWQRPRHVTSVIIENPMGQTTEIVRTGAKLSSVTSANPESKTD
ncbi:MAG: hypothetical protein L3J65_11050 [Robiginitomaculum sp.]|nr:hypothetical protein [Robiginitomaculum sp.]